jgi:hypothetical protein
VIAQLIAAMVGVPAVLVVLAATRMLAGHWITVHAEHVPLDFMRLTIAGIPIEMLYGPDAVHHPYPLSDPIDFVDQPIVPPADTGASWHENVTMLRAQWRIAAQGLERINPFKINGC